MGGIAVILNTDGAPVEAATLLTLVGTARCHPPGIDGCAGLSHVPRTPDDAAESQPRGDGDGLWAVLDGRLDDRASLLAALATRDDRPDLARLADVDLIVRAYQKWGEDCARRLLGDFAFCVWDARQRRLVCARDHFGVKPLYYARVGRTLVVSSVLRWVRRHPAVSPRLRDEAVGDFLLFGVCADPAQTAFADIARVPPAHGLVYSLQTDSLRVTRYWALQPGELVRPADPGECARRFASHLHAAVADRLGPPRAGVLMSGGLDSSSVAATAAGILGSAAPDRLRAFTVVYDTLMKDEERHHSSVTAASLGIRVSHMRADEYRPFERWGADSLPPEPSIEGLSAVMVDLLDLVSEHSHTALTGDGGDPLLLPTPVVGQLGRVPLASLAGDLWNTWRLGKRPPFGIRSSIARWRGERRRVPCWLGRDLRKTFDARARVREIMARGRAAPGARRIAASEITDPWWTSTFESLDPGATGRAVELRYPFFDVRLVSYALRLPPFPWCVNKHVLRAAMRGRLPESVRTRPKTPLPATPIAPGDCWSAAQAAELFEATPEMERFVDVSRFRASVHGASLLSHDSPGAWPAISLAAWLRCDAGRGLPAPRV